MNEATMPVLIGCGQVTDKRPPEEAGTPIELMAEVARKAAADAAQVKRCWMISMLSRR